MNTTLRFLCHGFLAGMLAAFCLMNGCGSKPRIHAFPLSADVRTAMLKAGSLSPKDSEVDRSETPSSFQLSSPQIEPNAASQRFIDDTYGTGTLGPRVLFHETEVRTVTPKRLNIALHASFDKKESLPPDIASIAALALNSASKSKQHTLTTASNNENGDSTFSAHNRQKNSPTELQQSSDPEVKTRAARPVRVWVVRDSRLARNASPLSASQIDTRAYLMRLGIHSVYDLSPTSRRLFLPSFGHATPLLATSMPAGGRSDYGRPSSPFTPKEWEEIVLEAGRLFGLDPRFISAIIKVESNFDHLAVSSKGAQGAMQIMPGTQKKLGLMDPFDVRANIHAGCAFLRELLIKYGSTELALAAYNAGPGAVDKYRGIPPYSETQNYVRRVMALWLDTTNQVIKKNENNRSSLEKDNQADALSTKLVSQDSNVPKQQKGPQKRKKAKKKKRTYSSYKQKTFKNNLE